MLGHVVFVRAAFFAAGVDAGYAPPSAVIGLRTATAAVRYR